MREADLDITPTASHHSRFTPFFLQKRNSYQNIIDLIVNYDTPETMHLAIGDQATGPHVGFPINIEGVNHELCSSPNGMVSEMCLVLMMDSPSRRFTHDDELYLSSNFETLTAGDTA